MKRGIVAAGNWIVDRVKMIDRWPGEGELCNILEQTHSAGGGPCNVLFDLAAMECDIPLYACGVLGDDEDGQYLLSQIRTKGIDDRYMTVSKSASTSYTDVMTVRFNGRRTFFHNRGANAELGYHHLDPVNVPARLFYLAYLLLLDELDRQDAEFGTVAGRVLSEMSRRGYKTVVDVVSEDSKKFRETVLPVLPHIDYLVINEVEAGACKGVGVRRSDGRIDVEQLVMCGRFLLDSGVRERIVIHYPEGALALEKGGVVHQRPSCRISPQDIVGSVGAGDAFCAGILYGIHEAMSVSDMLDLAAASAWFNLQSATASEGAPTLKRIRDHL